MLNFERDAKLRVYAPLASFIIATIMAFLVPKYGPIGFATIVASMLGAYLVIRSKLRSKARTRELIEWGGQSMHPQERRAYWMGYYLIVLSV